MPLSVAYRETEPGMPDKKRLIWNGRYVNRYLVQRPFRYESISMVRDLLDPVDGMMWSFDINSGYYHVELHPDSRTFVGFEWEGQFYVYCSLPFGLSLAPYVFTRIMRELARH